MSDNSLRETAFVHLADEELTALEHCPNTVQKTFRNGERLITVGQVDCNFFVVRRGEVEVVDESGDAPKRVTIHTPGGFVGDVSQLTNRPAIVSCIARGDTDVFEVSPSALRQLLNNHPQVGDKILQAFIARRQLLRESPDFVGLKVIGSRYSKDTFRIRDFLFKNQVPFTWLDLEADQQVADLLKQFGLTEVDTPVVAWGGKVLLRNPSNAQIADVIGMRRPMKKMIYDLVIVGAGPAGLAAAVYAASEGLRTVVLERSGPGGQAGRSMRIENYLGFPTGITGAELADRAVMQASKFGACLPVPTPVQSLSFDGNLKVLQLDDGQTVSAKCLIIATGAEYRVLDVEGCERFEGRGVYYAATLNEATMCRGAEVIVVGGGNSAGQAAVFLASQARKVCIVIRGDDLRKSMSSYLVDRIQTIPNIELLCNSEIKQMSGDGSLGNVDVISKKSGEARCIKTPAVFSFIGAVPRTEWLPPEIERDDKMFIRTGPSVVQSPQWTPKRAPMFLETTRPGVFAAGDVRSSSVKRVASAVGEGSMAVQFVHEYLKEF